MRTAFAQVGSPDAKAAAQRGFKGYGPGKRQKKEKPKIAENKAIERFWEVWREVACGCVGLSENMDEEFVRYYTGVLPYLKGFDFSPKDVEKFSLLLHEYQHEDLFYTKMGFFLSALVSFGEHTDYTIHTELIDAEIYCLGLLNRKNVTIMGNAGEFLGNYMISGKITVTGDAGRFVGWHMTGGEIHIEGEIGTYIQPEGGRLFHKGKLIAGSE